MTNHSKMLTTRRIRQKRMKDLAKAARQAKKLGKQDVKAVSRKAPSKKAA